MPQSDKNDSQAGKNLYPSWSEKLLGSLTHGVLVPNQIAAPGTLLLRDDRLRIPQDIPLHSRQDELMGRNSWSTLLIRPNGLNSVVIESQYFFILSCVSGLLLISRDDEKEYATRRDEIICCVPGRYVIQTANEQESATFANAFCFAPGTARLWLSAGYVHNGREIFPNEGNKIFKTRPLRFIDPFSVPAGVYAFSLVRLLGFTGDSQWPFSKFLKNGDLTLAAPHFATLSIDTASLPHLDIIESRRRKAYPDLRRKMLNFQEILFYRPPCFFTPEQLKSHIR